MPKLLTAKYCSLNYNAHLQSDLSGQPYVANVQALFLVGYLMHHGEVDGRRDVEHQNERHLHPVRHCGAQRVPPGAPPRKDLCDEAASERHDGEQEAELFVAEARVQRDGHHRRLNLVEYFDTLKQTPPKRIKIVTRSDTPWELIMMERWKIEDNGKKVTVLFLAESKLNPGKILPQLLAFAYFVKEFN